MVETRGERGRGLVGAGEVVVEMIVEPWLFIYWLGEGDLWKGDLWLWLWLWKQGYVKEILQ